MTWSWDISKLKGPAKWSYFHLYTIIDIYSRHIVGWMVATRESAELAERLLFDTIEKQNIRCSSQRRKAPLQCARDGR
ncbi:DDE-type integrase/transposase/recombinase [Cryobacterium sp. Hz9]|uniref:DDE-type integrase/transposase/recombinase n=1 Tax=Cryobacterium sp. Hz9 TaxID=1259167 RepID=UPI001F542D21|nr:DDE-type integrase/transposase/recombinase [Cryobacterium sp. Hz9]